MKLVKDGEKTSERPFPDTWSEFVIRIAKTNRQAEVDKYKVDVSPVISLVADVKLHKQKNIQ